MASFQVFMCEHFTIKIFTQFCIRCKIILIVLFISATLKKTREAYEDLLKIWQLIDFYFNVASEINARDHL